MATGPGKYDAECTAARRAVGIPDGTPGGVILVVFNGDRGHGFNVQADEQTTMRIPEILEEMARQIRKDLKRG